MAVGVLTLLATSCGGSDDGDALTDAARPSSAVTPEDSAAPDAPADPAAPLSAAGVEQALLKESDVGYGWEVAPDDEADEGTDEDGEPATSGDPACDQANTRAEDFISGKGFGSPREKAERGLRKGDPYTAEGAWVVGSSVLAFPSTEEAEEMAGSVEEAAEACNGKELTSGDDTLYATKITVPERGDESSGVRYTDGGMTASDLVVIREGANVSLLIIFGFSIADDADVQPDDELAGRLVDKAARRLHDAVAAAQD